ncbi:hypothetical protein F8M41_003554 [Gigaspora margarita]|uniref:Uncharacterized protein n=1 Tax=Gigaspora margarita TaxID=4874 RepID=A0A8H4ERZ0_GIGMA|nr:hypothetical protein F8M41_003554 [Gigaspora margarita]
MMGGKKDSELRDIIKLSKTKRDLILKLSRQKPEYLIENLSSIEHVAELIYDKKSVSKRKHDVLKFVQEEHPKLKNEYVNEDIFKVIGDRQKKSTKKKLSKPKKQQKKPVKKSLVKVLLKKTGCDTCNVGFCGNEAKEHICRFEREIGVQLKTITFGPRVDANDDRVYYFDTIWQRLFYMRLFQTNTEPFNNLELHDITIHLKLTTYHIPLRGNTHNLPTKQGNTTIMTLLSPMILHFHIVEICDLELAKKKNPILDDLLIDKNLKRIQFRESIKS